MVMDDFLVSPSAGKKEGATTFGCPFFVNEYTPLNQVRKRRRTNAANDTAKAPNKSA